MEVKPVTLQGRRVRLEPLSMEHVAELVALAEPVIFTFFGGPPRNFECETLRRYFEARIAATHWIPFAIVLQGNDRPDDRMPPDDPVRVVGTTTYMDIQPESRGLEIGSSWIGRQYQGTFVNPENKYLLLRHAFEELGAIRVQLKTDLRNVQSQRAIEKLGARREGILRKTMILPSGYVRDTVMYSIVDDEWPDVKAKLEARLGYTP
jgi:ribosomal-protein-alanine N-acetyltransferase